MSRSDQSSWVMSARVVAPAWRSRVDEQRCRARRPPKSPSGSEYLWGVVRRRRLLRERGDLGGEWRNFETVCASRAAPLMWSGFEAGRTRSSSAVVLSRLSGRASAHSATESPERLLEGLFGLARCDDAWGLPCPRGDCRLLGAELPLPPDTPGGIINHVAAGTSRRRREKQEVSGTCE